MKEFVRSENDIIVNCPYMEAYIPKALFTNDDKADEKSSPIAYEYGEGFVIFGVFNVRIFEDDSQDRESIKPRTFSYPNMIETYPSEHEERVLSLNGNEPEKYMILKYYQGDIVMEANFPQSYLNCEKFMTVLFAGKIPNTVPYGDINQNWTKNWQINGFDSPLYSAVAEACVSQVCRVKSNPMLPFRKFIGKNPNVSKTDYIAINMRQITAFTNTMSAMTFEDIKLMTAASINMKRTGIKQSESSFEKILQI